MDLSAFRPLVSPPPKFELPWRRDLDSGIDLLRYIKNELSDSQAELTGPVSFVVNAEFVKTLNNFEAMIHLCVAGFGTQAKFLARSMFESVIMAWWARHHREDVDQLFPLYERYLQHLYFEMWPVGEWDGVTPPPLSDSDRAHAEKLFGKYGERNWTGSPLRVMATEMAKTIGAPVEHHVLLALNVVQRLFNWAIHSTSLSMRDTMEGDEGQWNVRLGSSPRGIFDALRSGWNGVSLVCSSYVEEFGVDWEPGLTKHLAACWSAMYDPKTLRETGRNDMCPCGSGVKFKKCHARFLEQ